MCFQHHLIHHNNIRFKTRVNVTIAGHIHLFKIYLQIESIHSRQCVILIIVLVVTQKYIRKILGIPTK